MRRGGFGLLLLLLVMAVVLALALITSWRLDRANRAMVARLWPAAGPSATLRFQPSMLQGLPAPVVRYFQQALPPGTPLARRVRLHQVGQMRLSPQGRWLEFQAAQYITTGPPGFVWDATFPLGPLPWLWVVDRYHGGHGNLQARLFATFTVAEAGDDARLDQGELMRYLAEAVWVPEALLPVNGVQWSALDANSARATLHDGASTVSLRFHFNAAGEIVRADAAARWRQVGARYEARPWFARYHDYRRRQGRRIPSRGEVGWVLPAGEYLYWRGRISAIDFAPAQP